MKITSGLQGKALRISVASTIAAFALGQAAPALAAAGLTKQERADLAASQTSAQGIWYSTSPWSERQADLRDALSAGKSVTPGVWTKGLMGRTMNSSDAASSYEQKTYGVVAGVDFGSEGVFAANDALIFGVSAGHINSNVDFSNSNDTSDYKGWVGGLYATYIRGGFFVDATAKINELEMSYTTTTFVTSNITPDVETIGGQIDMGQRFDLGSNYFAEPLASISYAQTSTDSAKILGTSIDFDDAKSLRASVGGRVGRVLNRSEGAIVTASLTGKVWNEFEGENKVNFNNGIRQYENDFSGALGDINGGFEVTGMNGLSGFINAGLKFKSDYNDASLKIGARYNF